jgi:hypothetical protein
MIKATKILLAAAFCAAFSVSCAPSAARAGKGAAPKEPATPPSAAEPAASGPTTAEPAARAAPDAAEEDMAFGGGAGSAEFERLDDAAYLRRERGDARGMYAPERPEPAAPAYGGKATIYLQRGFLDDAVAEMVRLNPFGAGQGRRLFNVTDSTHRRLEFTMAGAVTRANGHRATALDFVELWSRFITSRPAQGLALFRNVQGVENFINGKDPLVNGWNAADERTVKIRFAKPDPIAFHRMNTSKLVGGPFMMGAYYSGGARGDEIRLLPNKNSPADTAFLAECVVRMGGDPDPLASFAEGRYAAAALYLSADLETARTEFVGAGKASLHKLPSDRYFLACKNDDGQACKFVRGITDGADMLKNLVAAEGEAISGVYAQDETPVPPSGRALAPTLPKPFRIIYRDDDPISKTVAEKLSSDLTGAGVAADLAGHNAEKYETALVKGAYDCAVGWVPETVLENFTEQLHFASMWFGDETDPQTRLRECREIPLFSVDNYMLLREDVWLHRGKLSGMWIYSAD